MEERAPTTETLRKTNDIISLFYPVFFHTLRTSGEGIGDDSGLPPLLRFCLPAGDEAESCHRLVQLRPLFTY